MTAIASPFAIERLPPQARFYKQAFRSGTSKSSRLSRLLNRIAFYACETFGRQPSYGRFAYGQGEDAASIRFDARNRQYSSIYFDAFLPVYEPDVTAAILQFAPLDGVFYDVGSNWGYFSLFLAARPGFSGQIHAFEPWPPTYGDLVSMVEQAGLTDVITAHQKAVGAQPGTVMMQCGRHSGLARIAESAAEGVEAVEQVTLDSLAIAAPAFMKLDVEGAEAAILSGGQQLLAESRPVLVFEHTPDSAGDGGAAVITLLREQDYDLYQPRPTLEPAAPFLLRLEALTMADVMALPQRCNLLAVPTEQRESLRRYLAPR